MTEEDSTTDNRHIVVVDDDPMVRTTLRDCLESGGYRVTDAADGAGLFAAMARERVDLVSLDLRLHREDGLQIAREIRSVSDVPIIMVTAVDDSVDRVVGLEIGADDYIVKPFHVREVLARVRTVLRRYGGTPPLVDPGFGGVRSIMFDGWRLDLHQRRLGRPRGRARC